jgi:hydrogenase expression/formation protein HypE
LEGEKKMAIRSCPLPLPATERILLAHGGGGRLTNQLIESVFLPAFRNPALESRHDGALFSADGVQLAMTTDTYVVQPLVFPGGSIGDLAVNGTVNDLAMCGARPLALSAGFVLEEGLPLKTLHAIVDSMREAARIASVSVVTGDTKVLDKGRGDGLFINTAGIGVVLAPHPIGPEAVRQGDAVIVSGDLGMHGIAVLSVREGLEFEGEVKSDTAPLWPAIEALFNAGIEIRCLRDLTRGGLASALNEIATVARLNIEVEESLIPVSDVVRGACELLGLDPLYVANEGRFVAFVPEREVSRALEVLRSQPVAAGAVRAGTVHETPSAVVTLRTRIGGNRVLDMLSGEQLPRIC